MKTYFHVNDIFGKRNSNHLIGVINNIVGSIVTPSNASLGLGLRVYKPKLSIQKLPMEPQDLTKK